MALAIAGWAASSCGQEALRPVSVEVIAGAGRANLEGAQPEYRGGFAAASFTFPLDRRNRSGNLSWQIEPSVGAEEDGSSVEAAVAVFLRYGWPGRVSPYIKVGTGPYYMSRTTEEQSTRFNFASSVAAGLQIDRFLVECRWRHVSNAGISEPNGGINTTFLLVGFSHRF